MGSRAASGLRCSRSCPQREDSGAAQVRARASFVRFCGASSSSGCVDYAKRVLGTERYRAVNLIVKALGTAMATWSSVIVEPPAEGEIADRLREELGAAARSVELPLSQARVLAQAALLPATELLDAAGVVTAKGKRRLHPMLENDPPDPRCRPPRNVQSSPRWRSRHRCEGGPFNRFVRFFPPRPRDGLHVGGDPTGQTAACRHS